MIEQEGQMTPDPEKEPTALDRLKAWLNGFMKDVTEWIAFMRREDIKNLRAANQQPSTNTKTKLDLTKANLEFHKPSIASANIYF